ncbi:MAG: hypothetical protein Q4E13_05885 [Clostridia bacterium]|nr:hypothetical protein [Clostridia bacterium]
MKRFFLVMICFLVAVMSVSALAEELPEEAPAVVEQEASTAEGVSAEQPEVAPEEDAAVEQPEDADPSEDVGELPEDSSASRLPVQTSSTKKNSSSSTKTSTQKTTVTGQTETGDGLTSIQDGEVPLYDGMQTGDGEIYAVSLLTMASALLLISGAIAKMRG